MYKVYQIEPLRVGLPHIRTLVVRDKTVAQTARKRFKVKTGKSAATAADTASPGEPQNGEDPVSYFLGTCPPGPAEPFAQLIRGHWGGCEIRNHGARDVQWQEDKTRSGNWALNANLAILRVALISVKFRQGVTLSWPMIFEKCVHSTVPVFSLINGKSIKWKDRGMPLAWPPPLGQLRRRGHGRKITRTPRRGPMGRQA